jgi:hypothetical protein
MAYFAKLDSNSKVLQVLKVNDSEIINSQNQEDEEKGINYLRAITSWSSWKKTSYNTWGGKHYITDSVTGERTLSNDQSKAFRKNYAGIGYTYDESRDAFIPPKEFESWVLNETTCNWEPPVQAPNVLDPTDRNLYEWDESIQNWSVIGTLPEEPTPEEPTP